MSDKYVRYLAPDSREGHYGKLENDLIGKLDSALSVFLFRLLLLLHHTPEISIMNLLSLIKENY